MKTVTGQSLRELSPPFLGASSSDQGLLKGTLCVVSSWGGGAEPQGHLHPPADAGVGAEVTPAGGS